MPPARGKGLAGQSSTQVAGAGEGHTARLGTTELGPQVTKKGVVGQEVLLVAESQSSPQAAVNPPSVEAPAIYNAFYYPWQFSLL